MRQSNVAPSEGMDIDTEFDTLKLINNGQARICQDSNQSTYLQAPKIRPYDTKKRSRKANFGATFVIYILSDVGIIQKGNYTWRYWNK